MLKLTFEKQNKDPFKILCLGAHSDDIEIGCGGTILRLAQEFPNLQVVWIVFSAQGVREEEARKSANLFLHAAKEKQIVLQNFRDGYFPYIGAEIKDNFENLKAEFSPNLIFTHYRDDLHQDHRLICELTWNTFRDHLILEYEVPKYDGDFGIPNFFVPLDEKICRRKVESVVDIFTTQTGKDWFTADFFYAHLRLRGAESRSPSKYAEAYYARKVIFNSTIKASEE